MKRNLFLKIFFSYLIIISLSLLVLDLLISDKIRHQMIGRIESEMLAYAELVDLGSPQEMARKIKQVAGISGARVTLVDAGGKVYADSEKDIAGLENHLNRPEIQEARLRGSGRSIRYSQTLSVDMLYVAVTIKAEQKLIGYVRLARPLHDVQRAIEKVVQSIWLAMMIIAFLAFGIALIFSYRLAAPIRAMEDFTKRLREGHHPGALVIKTADETKTLADNINYLVDELQSKIRLANEEKSKLMTALTSINEGVLILNHDERIEFLSPSLANTLSGQYGDFLGRTLMEAFRNVDLEKTFQLFKQTKEGMSKEITLGGAEPVIMRVTLSKIHGVPDDEKVMVIFHDVTRLKKLERIRTDFVANVTHEIRTPLTAIIGYLETLQSGALEHPEDARRFTGIMLHQAYRLNRLVEDLMTISKIELGEVVLQLEDLSVLEVADNVLSLLDAKAKDKHVIVENRIPLDLPLIRADRDRLSQVFVNVLDNAIKFTPESGRVTLEAAVKEEMVVMSITDTGAGIPKGEIARLGERFYRVDKTRSRELGGTGLGLSIVKHLMMVHGGKMEIESQLGYGTKVSLFLPKAKIS